MSTFTFNLYLVQDIDGDGTDDYIVTDVGERIVISTQSITVDTNFRYIGGQIARKPGSRPALTFEIKKRPNNTWYMLVNQTTFCGLYSEREDCLGVLYGYYTSFSGSDDGFATWLADSLEKGSVLDPDENILTLVSADPDLSVTLASINTSTLTEGVDPADYASGIFLGWQTQQPGSSTWDGITTSNIIDLAAPIVDGPDLTQTTTGSQWAASVPENGYVRPVVIAVDGSLGLTVIADGAPVLKDDANDTDLTGLSLSISGDPAAIVPVEVGGFAYALVDESGAVLDPGETIAYDNYQWYREIPELTGITNDASPPVPVIGAVSIVETDGPTYDGDGTTQYTFTIDTSNATATDLTYLWSVASAAGGTFDVTTPLTGTSIEVQFDNASTAYEINCTVSSATASDSPQDATEVQITTEASAYTNIMSFSTTTANSATATTESGIDSTSLVADIGWQGRNGNGIQGIIAFASLDPDRLRIYVSNGETVAATQAVFTDYELVKVSDSSVVGAFDILGAGGVDQMDFSQTGNNALFEPNTDYILRGIRA